MTLRILVRGGGDLASGAVMRLHRAGWQVLVTELAQPLAVRRYVSFAQAVYAGELRIEEITARRVDSPAEVEAALAQGVVPVAVDPDLVLGATFAPQVILDGRMRKKPPETRPGAPGSLPLVIGLGPGFEAGIDCHAVVETNRGPFLGRVIWQGAAQEDTGVPEQVGSFRGERVLRAPVSGLLEAAVDIGSLLKEGDLIASVGGRPLRAPFDGVLRGLLMGGLRVTRGDKIGDIDPRSDPRLCWLVSDKALAVGGGVVEAILAWTALRPFLWA